MFSVCVVVPALIERVFMDCMCHACQASSTHTEPQMKKHSVPVECGRFSEVMAERDH